VLWRLPRPGDAGLAASGRRSFSEGGKRVPHYQEAAVIHREAAAFACPKAKRKGSAATSPSDQQCRERNAGNAPASGNEGVGEHVRTRFHFDREATREIAEPENRSRTERRKLVSSAGPDFGERTRERERSDR